MLKGASIRETAVRVLLANHERDRPVHYRDWFALLTARGFMPGGKDPLATFLTQISRSPHVQRTTMAGMYVLDHDLVSRARMRLAELGRELEGTRHLEPAASIDQIETARAQRARITSEIQETERHLREASRLLGEIEG